MLLARSEPLIALFWLGTVRPKWIGLSPYTLDVLIVATADGKTARRRLGRL
jgi:hypothetical protein